MAKILSPFFRHLAYPTQTAGGYEKFNLKELKALLFLLLFIALFNGLIITVRFLLINYEIMPPLHFKEYGQHTSMFYFSIFVLLFSPIAEEIGFRAMLVPTPINISLSMSTITYFALSMIIPYRLYSDYYLIIPVLLFFIVLLSLPKQFGVRLQNHSTKFARAMLYSTTILFTFFHTKDFSISAQHIVWLPLISLPYIAIGLTLGYVRCRFGILYSILFHAAYNAVPLVLSLVALS